MAEAPEVCLLLHRHRRSRSRGGGGASALAEHKDPVPADRLPLEAPGSAALQPRRPSLGPSGGLLGAPAARFGPRRAVVCLMAPLEYTSRLVPLLPVLLILLSPF